MLHYDSRFSQDVGGLLWVDGAIAGHLELNDFLQRRLTRGLATRAHAVVLGRRRRYAGECRTRCTHAVRVGNADVQVLDAAGDAHGAAARSRYHGASVLLAVCLDVTARETRAFLTQAHTRLLPALRVCGKRFAWKWWWKFVPEGRTTGENSLEPIQLSRTMIIVSIGFLL